MRYKFYCTGLAILGIGLNVIAVICAMGEIKSYSNPQKTFVLFLIGIFFMLLYIMNKIRDIKLN